MEFKEQLLCLFVFKVILSYQLTCHLSLQSADKESHVHVQSGLWCSQNTAVFHSLCSVSVCVGALLQCEALMEQKNEEGGEEVIT